MKKICVIYANCQGSALLAFLQNHKAYNDKYENHLLENYQMIEKGLPLPIQLLRQTDLFIYQPIKSKHGQYATDHMQQHLPETCTKISFPYIYCDALWPLYEENDKIVGEEIILKLIEKGYSLKKIIDMFCGEEINFEFAARFEKSIQILMQKEEGTDVKVSDYILDNLSKEKLFLTENHQTSSVYIHCINQILTRLELPPIDASRHLHPNEAALPDCWPTSPYEAKHYHYSYSLDWRMFHPEKIDSNWHRFYLRIIGKIFLKAHRRSFASRMAFKSYLRYRIQLSLLKGDGYWCPDGTK